MVKPKWLREHEKNLKNEYRVKYKKHIKRLHEPIKVTKIEIEPEKTAKKILQLLLKKFGLKK